MTKTIEKLTEQNFQEFLNENLKQIFVYETEDYEYQHYFPTAFKIMKSGTGNGRFARQWG
jgi:hypothetical protein